MRRPIVSKVRAVLALTGTAGALALADAISTLDLGFFGRWENVAVLAVGALVAYLRGERALADYLRAAGDEYGAEVVGGKVGERPTPAPGAPRT